MRHATGHAVTKDSGRHIPLTGNHLCVDFLNCSGAFGQEWSWGDLVSFFVQSKIISPAKRESLRGLEINASVEVGRAFEAALELRDAIGTCLAARVEGGSIELAWVSPINRILRCTEGYDQLVLEPGRAEEKSWAIKFIERERRLEWLLAPIARSAAALIAEGPGAPVRKCANPACVLFFYDTSRTGQRRWCSMTTCGNRHKVAAHARRQRQATS